MSLPAEIDGYRVVGLLGEGGIGRVYEVERDDLPGRRLALKLLRRANAPEATLKRFEREAQLLARVRHPGVVAVHAAGRTAEGQYLVMDLVEGATLEAHREAGPLPCRQAAELVAALAAAVAELHRAGIVHRDLKPENVVLRPDGTPVLIDFGVAKGSEDERLTRSGTLLGSPCYMAPEQAWGAPEKLDARTDVWGLGGVLFALLAGRPPFDGDSLTEVLRRVQTQEPRWPSLDDEGFPADLEAILRHCLAKDPAARWKDARTLEVALRAYLAGQPTELPRRPRLVWAWFAGSALFAVAAGVAGWAWPARPTAAIEAAPIDSGRRAPAKPLGGERPAAVLTLQHGPAAATGVRFVSADRLLTWSATPPWKLEEHPEVGARSAIWLWRCPRGGDRPQAQPLASEGWTVDGRVDHLVPLSLGALLVVRHGPGEWSLRRLVFGSPHTEELDRTLTQSPSCVTALAVSPDESWVVYSESVRNPTASPPLQTSNLALDLRSRRRVVLHAGLTSVTHDIRFLTDGRVLAASEDTDAAGAPLGHGALTLWRVTAGPDGALGVERSSAFRRRDPPRSACATAEGAVWSGSVSGAVSSLEAFPDDPPLGRLAGPVLGLAALPGGHELVALAGDRNPRANELRLLDLRPGARDGARGLKGWSAPLSSLDVAPDGVWVAVGLVDRAELISVDALRRAPGRRDELDAR